MTAASTIAFLLISFMAIAILIKLGSLIYRAIVLNSRDYDGREWFDDYMRIDDDLLRYDPIDIEIIDRTEAYEQG